jgi:PAS domain S-box-containing protein
MTKTRLDENDLNAGPERRAQEALRQSDARKAAIFEASLDCIISIDSDGKIIEFNAAAERTFGYSRDHVIGRDMAEVIIPPSLRDKHHTGLARYLATGQGPILNKRLEMSAVRSDGTEFPVELTVAPLPGSGPSKFTAFLRDITERKQAVEALRASETRLRQRAEELETLMDLLPVAVWIARDPECREIDGNRAGNALLRVEAGRNLSKSPGADDQPTHFRITHDGRELQPHELPMQHAAANGVEVRGFEEEIEFNDGTVVRAYGSAVPLYDEDRHVRGAIAAFMDVTDMKQLQKQLQQTVADLAEADRRKDEFLATLAHELRNPLAPIRNAVQILRAYGSGDPALRWSEDVIDRQVSHLTRLIDDLLDVNRITRNELELRIERVDLAEAVRSAVETSRPLIEQSGHRLTVTLPPEAIYLNADLVRLSQVFMNLLTNAARYMERGGSIWIAAGREGRDVVVRVRDTGVGIPVDLLPRVFEMFFRVDRSLEKAQGGLGVGLALTRRLVEMHGGKIEARSDGPGKGSEFVVRLPAPMSTPVSQPAMPSSHGAMPRAVRRILVADDVRDAADSLAIALRLSGHEVRTAYDGVSALAEAEQFRPEVAILDIGMPGLTGYEACQRIRERPWGKDIMLIAVTGWGGPEDARRAIEAGFDRKMVKPADPNAILRLLEVEELRAQT